MTTNSDIIIGCHVGMSSPNFYLQTVKDAISFTANTFMFYTGAPQNSLRKPTSELKIEEGRKLLLENGFDESKIIVHAPYIVNLANTVNEELFQKSIDFIKQEIKRVNDFHLKNLVLHPGSHVGAGIDLGIDKLISGLNEIFKDDDTPVRVLIETMAGKGAEIGSTFEQIKRIIDGVVRKDKIGVCLDTCHIHDEGYDVADPDKIIEEFNRIIGLEYLGCVHINDSKNLTGSHKDRHENIGYGDLGFEVISLFVHHKLLKGVPMILETPYIGDKPPYKKEIEMLRSNQYIENWKELL